MPGDFTKLFHKFFRSSISRESAETRIVFLGMISLCDKNGLVESTVDGISRHVALSYEVTEAALERLQAPDPESTTPDEDGRRVIREPGNRWRVVTFRKYWDLQQKEERREYLAEAKRRQRDRERAEQGSEEPADPSTVVNNSQQESTAVDAGQRLSPSPSPSPSKSLSQTPIFRNEVIEPGPKTRKPNEQAQRVARVEAMIKEFGATPPAPKLIGKWLSEFEEIVFETVIREIGPRGGLSKGEAYFYGCLKRHVGGEHVGRSGSKGRGNFDDYDRR
jgi:hypothetical protein